MRQPEEPGPDQSAAGSPQRQRPPAAGDGEFARQEPAPDAAGADAEAERQHAFADPATLRRAPRYGRFAITGVIAGIVISAAAVLLFAEPTEYLSLTGVFALVTVLVAPLCALLACLLALLVETRRSRRAKKASGG